MSQINDNLFGMHTQALGTWQKRAETIAGNLANADTPGYLARDVDFRKALADASSSDKLALSSTNANHIDPSSLTTANLAYRVPMQPTMDGNTVDTQVEQANFAANSVHYQASLSFITAQIRMLRTAITGGQG
ncbi:MULTISPECIES: flagellar basal body rod protein FlgB [Dyella]|uniref:Flagellar basal body rod protein FlgB n=2 Tax=Dyella TaxID=231454 RepID=A0A4R0YH43_9GAMM|nr:MULTISPECIES: flagellar basal body rod protein FlgB [Dyella]TBR37180.1 flagellar basal body rod protein FlgB [Dyella terrae]TCI07730.1 flagellar basal body rod protein FlgB [Dyella soli]